MLAAAAADDDAAAAAADDHDDAAAAAAAAAAAYRGIHTTSEGAMTCGQGNKKLTARLKSKMY